MTRPGYAAGTTVPVERSRSEIEKLLVAHGAGEFAYSSRPDRQVIGFELGGRYIRYTMPMPDRSARQFTHTPTGRQRRSAGEAAAAYEQAVRARWRALLLIIKAKLEAVHAGVSTLESEFLAWTLVPDGRTVGDWLTPELDKVYGGGDLPALMPGPTRP
jgi:hypothetical protein